MNISLCGIAVSNVYHGTIQNHLIVIDKLMTVGRGESDAGDERRCLAVAVRTIVLHSTAVAQMWRTTTSAHAIASHRRIDTENTFDVFALSDGIDSSSSLSACTTERTRFEIEQIH